MRIRFTRGREKEDTIACFRDDGTVTWARVNVGVEHDLIHYVVETTLGSREAFYGLLDAGWDIHDFGAVDPAIGRKRVIPAEAGQVEHLVGLLQGDLLGVLRIEDVEGTPYAQALPDLAPEQLEGMRREIRAIVEQWRRVPPGGHLELVFEPGRG